MTSTLLYNKWDTLVLQSCGSLTKLEAFTVNNYTAYCYVWKARLRRYSKNNGISGYETTANEDNKIKTFIVTTGEVSDYKQPPIVFYELFKNWMSGNANGTYLLDNYNFIILPVLDVELFDACTGDDRLNQHYPVGTDGNSQGHQANSLTNAIATFLNSGVMDCLKSSSSETLDKWDYSYTTALLNLRQFKWRDEESAETSTHAFEDTDSVMNGIYFRAHYADMEDIKEAIFEAASASVNTVLDSLGQSMDSRNVPGSTLMHFTAAHTYGLASEGMMNAYRSAMIELPTYVGDSYNTTGAAEYNTKSFYISLTNVFHTIFALTRILCRNPARIYRSLTDIGCHILTGDNPAVTSFEKMARALPPGGVLNVGLSSTYLNSTYITDFPTGLIGNGAGTVYIYRGGNEYGGNYRVAQIIYSTYLGKTYQKTVYTGSSGSTNWYTIDRTQL